VDVNSASVGPRTFDFPGTTPTISAHGSADAIVWALQRGGGGPAVLAAYNSSNLSTEIYNSTQAAGSRDQLPVGIKFAVPVVANGKVFVGGQNSLSVFGLLQSPYNLWKNFHFGPNANDQSIAGDTADPDHDQIINVLEYAFGSDPNFTDLTKPIYGDIGSVGFELHFTRNITASDLAYTVQRANGLGGAWNAIATYNVGTGWVTNEGVSVSEDSGSGSPPDQIALVTLTDQSVSVSNGNAFYRVSVGRQ